MTYTEWLNKELEEKQERIKNLVSKNTKLQNDLFSEQLIQDEQDEYIEKLKSNINHHISEKYEWIEKYKQSLDENKQLKQQLKETREFFVDIKKENFVQNEIIEDYREQNLELREDLGTYKNFYNEQLELIRQIDNLTNGISFLKDKIDVDKLTIIHENKKLKDELKEANSDVGIFIEEQNQLKDRISNLVSENVKLQNDLFTEQLIQDEQDEYINRLKLELFELYRNKQ